MNKIIESNRKSSECTTRSDHYLKDTGKNDILKKRNMHVEKTKALFDNLWKKRPESA